MQKDYGKSYYRTTLAALSPAVDQLRRLTGTIRHAFNRSSMAELAEADRLQDVITLDLDEYFEEVEAAQAVAAHNGNPYLKKISGILGHLEHIGDELKKMGAPIARKIKASTLVSDKDYFHLNDLFTHTIGLLRGLADLFHAENKPLKRYLLTEASNLIEGCFQAEVEHDLQMVQSFGQPQAFAIYLELLERFKKILNHLTDIVKIVDEKIVN